jgi:predicted SnoaL-like aldol condensation-catalyzing enzyme
VTSSLKTSVSLLNFFLECDRHSFLTLSREIMGRNMSNPFTVKTRNRELALQVLTGAFIDKDPSVVERLFSPAYKQHNPEIPDGPEVIRSLIEGLPAEFRYEPGMIVADEDLVMVHGRYVGWAPDPMIAVDIFRFVDGKVVEHWDVMQKEVGAEFTKSGNGMFP